MCVKINVKVATSSVKYGGFPLNILIILLKMKMNNDHFLKLHIFKYHNLVFWLFILTRHILVKTVPSSLFTYIWPQHLFTYGSIYSPLHTFFSLHKNSSLNIACDLSQPKTRHFGSIYSLFHLHRFLYFYF